MRVMILLLFFLQSISWESHVIRWCQIGAELKNSRVHSTADSEHRSLRSSGVFPHRCPLLSGWNGAWWSCWLAAAAAASVSSLSASLFPALYLLPPNPPPPGKRNGFFHANLSLSQQRWRQPKCESRGGRRKAPSLPAIAVRRLLLLWSHSGKTFPFIVGNIFHEDPARTTAVVKVNGFLGLSVSTLWTGHISA